MNRATIRKHVVDVLTPMLAEEKGLFILNVNEPAIAHRLACRLTTVFAPLKWDVDCEYNRDGLDGKKVFDQLSYIMVRRARQIAEIEEKGGLDAVVAYLSTVEPISVFPDIIIHHRGRKYAPDNLLVIEIKKTTNKEDRGVDDEKLRIFTQGYSMTTSNAYYQLGLSIEFTAWDTRPTLGTIKAIGHWFQGGGKDETPDPLAEYSFELPDLPQDEE